MKRKFILLVAATLLSSLAVGQPSTYFLWKHKTNGKTMCNPEAPDAHWIKAGGPFEDSNCTIKQLQ